MSYNSQSRFQVVKVVVEDGKERYVNGPALPIEEQAITEAKQRFNQFGGLWLVYDTKPRPRSGGHSDINVVVFDTLAMHREAVQFLIDRGHHEQ